MASLRPDRYDVASHAAAALASPSTELAGTAMTVEVLPKAAVAAPVWLYVATAPALAQPGVHVVGTNVTELKSSMPPLGIVLGG